MRFLFSVFIPLLIFVFATVNSSYANEDEPVKSHYELSGTELVPGEPFTLTIILEMKEGWHTYYQNPGDSGFATQISVSMDTEDVVISDIIWPKDYQTFVDGEMVTYGYEDEVHLSKLITIPENVEKESVTFEVRVQWLACNEVCLPGEEVFSFTLPIVKKSL